MVAQVPSAPGMIWAIWTYHYEPHLPRCAGGSRMRLLARWPAPTQRRIPCPPPPAHPTPPAILRFPVPCADHGPGPPPLFAHFPAGTALSTPAFVATGASRAARKANACPLTPTTRTRVRPSTTAAWSITCAKHRYGGLRARLSFHPWGIGGLVSFSISDPWPVRAPPVVLPWL